MYKKLTKFVLILLHKISLPYDEKGLSGSIVKCR